jgi:hypothetical protein
MSSDFIEFLYKIIMLEPPASLRNDFLALCYECFSLKHGIGESNVLICDKMPRRFAELVHGNGMEFLELNHEQWINDILHYERNVRIAAHQVIVAVLSDIVTRPLNEN